jgi:hypothetical protein
MKTAAEILENELNNIGFSFVEKLKPDNITLAEVRKTKRAIIKAMESYATEREQKWKELYEKQKELNEEIEYPVNRGRDTELCKKLRQHIAELEKELGLKEIIS